MYTNVGRAVCVLFMAVCVWQCDIGDVSEKNTRQKDVGAEPSDADVQYDGLVDDGNSSVDTGTMDTHWNDAGVDVGDHEFGDLDASRSCLDASDGSDASDGGEHVDSGYVFQCAACLSSDREGALEIGFVNNTSAPLFLQSSGSRIRFVLDTSYYYPRDLCGCDTIVERDGCSMQCDNSRVLNGEPFVLQSGSSVLSNNYVDDLGYGAVYDGYNTVACDYSCWQPLAQYEYHGHCVVQSPIPSGVYRVVFCVSKARVESDGGWMDLGTPFECPQGYVRLEKQITLSMVDRAVFVNIEEGDLP